MLMDAESELIVGLDKKIADLTEKLFEARAERDKALEGRHEWMQKTTEARQEIARLKEVIAQLCTKEKQ